MPRDLRQNRASRPERGMVASRFIGAAAVAAGRCVLGCVAPPGGWIRRRRRRRRSVSIWHVRARRSSAAPGSQSPRSQRNDGLDGSREAADHDRAGATVDSRPEPANGQYGTGEHRPDDPRRRDHRRPARERRHTRNKHRCSRRRIGDTAHRQRLQKHADRMLPTGTAPVVTRSADDDRARSP